MNTTTTEQTTEYFIAWFFKLSRVNRCINNKSYKLKRRVDYKSKQEILLPPDVWEHIKGYTAVYNYNINYNKINKKVAINMCREIFNWSIPIRYIKQAHQEYLFKQIRQNPELSHKAYLYLYNKRPNKTTYYNINIGDYVVVKEGKYNYELRDVFFVYYYARITNKKKARVYVDVFKNYEDDLNDMYKKIISPSNTINKKYIITIPFNKDEFIDGEKDCFLYKNITIIPQGIKSFSYHICFQNLNME